MTEQEIIEQNVNNTLSQYIGTEQYYPIPLSSFKYTDGVECLIRLCGCYWLISDTAIFMSSEEGKDLKEKEFLILTIKVNEDKSCDVSLKEDTDTPILYHKKYGYTNFPLREFEFYIINEVMLLKNEY
jgi:hypothetical protein